MDTERLLHHNAQYSVGQRVLQLPGTQDHSIPIKRKAVAASQEAALYSSHASFPGLPPEPWNDYRTATSTHEPLIIPGSQTSNPFQDSSQTQEQEADGPGHEGSFEDGTKSTNVLTETTSSTCVNRVQGTAQDFCSSSP